MSQFKTVEEVMQNPEYKEALVELLYQQADDDFLLAFRGSEWLGLAPHIEEDVAFSSISQDTMGHAAMFYELLEELGEGDADALAHARPAEERKNAILLEEANGTGTYLEEPRYDWAYAVVRNYFYDIAKKVRLASLRNSSYEPLAHASVKVNSELYYHIMHWKTWFKQLVLAGGVAREKMEAAIEKVWADFGGVLTLGDKAEKMAEFGIISSETEMKEQFLAIIKAEFEELGLNYPGEPKMEKGNGRSGEHTEDLTTALDTLSEVYKLDTVTAW